MKVEIRPEAYSPWQELEHYQQASARLQPGSYGACASFVGTMRDFNEGDTVQSMYLEHYAGMTETQLEELAAEAIQQHGLLDVLILHRIGEIRPNDPIVLVAVWSAHRKQAFIACRKMMEHLKSKATFWKKEQLGQGARTPSDGEQSQIIEERWVDKNTPG